jgi:uncharacterized protein YjaZ
MEEGFLISEDSSIICGKFSKFSTKKKLAKKKVLNYSAKTANKTFVKVVFNFSTNPRRTTKQRFQKLKKKTFSANFTKTKSQLFAWNVLN